MKMTMHLASGSISFDLLRRVLGEVAAVVDARDVEVGDLDCRPVDLPMALGSPDQIPCYPGCGL